MNLKTSLMPLAAVGLAIAPSSAFGCRVGHDQHIFEKAPPANVLPGARVLRVRLSTAPQALSKWLKTSPNPDGSALDYSLIGVARVAENARVRGQTFPVYAVVTSCSAFWVTTFGKAGPAIEGDYFLIGRLQRDGASQRFLAGGNHNGRWHLGI